MKQCVIIFLIHYFGIIILMSEQRSSFNPAILVMDATNGDGNEEQIQDQQLVEINFKNKNIGLAEIINLSSRNFPTLQILNLSTNGLNDKALKVLTTMWIPNLKQIILTQNNLTGIFVSHFTIPKLRRLSLNKNKINRKGMKELLSYYCPNLKAIEITDNLVMKNQVLNILACNFAIEVLKIYQEDFKITKAMENLVNNRYENLLFVF